MKIPFSKKQRTLVGSSIMIVPMIFAGIAAGTLAASMSLYLGSGLVFSACICIAAGSFSFIISATLLFFRFIVSRIWWSIDIDLRVNIIFSTAILFFIILFSWSIFIGAKGNLQASAISFVSGAIAILAWLSYTFDNFSAKHDASRIDEYF